MRWSHPLSRVPFARPTLGLVVLIAAFLLTAAAGWATDVSGPDAEVAAAFDSLGRDRITADAASRVSRPSPVSEFFPADDRAAGSVLFDLSHGPALDYPIPTEYSSFIAALQGWGFSVNVANDFINLLNYDVAVFAMVQIVFTANQVNRVRDFLDAGGILIIFAEWGPNPLKWNMTAINGLLSGLQSGLLIPDAKVIDPLNYYLYNFWVRVLDFSDHCLNRDVNEVIGLASSYVAVDNPASGLYFSSADSYLELGGAPGPFPLAAVADPAAHPDWRLAVVADTNIFSTDPGQGDFFNMADHARLAENIVFWCPCRSSLECDDGQWCNGPEVCDEETRQCQSAGSPCPDDGLFCNGTESCDESAAECTHTGDPCADDGLYCDGPESCDEATGACLSAGNPCVDDGVYCNGTETCDESGELCLHSGDPCLNDELFCNGSATCDEQRGECRFSGFPCLDDGLWCDGVESCDEENDECASSQTPCAEDGLFCNGTETCDELLHQCGHSERPCGADETCDEAAQRCLPGDDAGDDDTAWLDPDDDESDDDGNPAARRPNPNDKDNNDWWPLGELSGGCCAC